MTCAELRRREPPRAASSAASAARRWRPSAAPPAARRTSRARSSAASAARPLGGCAGAAIAAAPQRRRRRPSGGWSPSSSPTSSASRPLSEARDAEDVRELLARYFETAAHDDRALRRHGREVHRRRRDGGLGRAGRAARTTPSARSARRSSSSTRSARARTRPACRAARRRAHRRGGRHARRRGPGHGRRRPRQHGVADPVGRASPGTVLVGEATRRATEAAIAYEDAGAHEMKGKAEPVAALARAAGRRRRGGARRSAGLEAPFVGRDRELRLDQGPLPRDRRRAAGPPRLGQSASRASASRGWCGSSTSTSTGWPTTCAGTAAAAWPTAKGVAYWALAEMVRMRAGIVEDEAAEQRAAEAPRSRWQSALRRSRGARASSSRGSQHLLGPHRARRSRARRPFSAWRLFFERLAERFPRAHAVRGPPLGRRGPARLRRVPARLVAEPSDLRAHAGAARARRAAARAWGAGRRASRSVSSSRCRTTRWTSSSRARAGTPDDAALAQIRERAEGIPLYAVETVRMLLDRGLLERTDGGYRSAGDRRRARGSRDAARADRRTARRTRTPRSAGCSRTRAVLGKTFTQRGARALSARTRTGRAAARLAGAQGAARPRQADPLSPERASTVPPGARAAGRVRDALATSARRGTWRWRAYLPRTLRSTRTRSPRCSRRTTSTRSPGRTGRGGRRRDPTRRPADAADARRRASRVPRCGDDEAQRASRQAVEPHGRDRASGRVLLERAGDMAPQRQPPGPGRRHSGGARTRCSSRRATTHAAARARRGIAGAAVAGRAHARGARAQRGGVRGARRTSRRRRSRARRTSASAGCTYFLGDRERAPSRVEWRSRSPSALRLPAHPFAQALITKRSRSTLEAPHRRATPCCARRFGSRSTMTSSSRPAGVQQPRSSRRARRDHAEEADAADRRGWIAFARQRGDRVGVDVFTAAATESLCLAAVGRRAERDRRDRPCARSTIRRADPATLACDLAPRGAREVARSRTCLPRRGDRSLQERGPVARARLGANASEARPGARRDAALRGGHRRALPAGRSRRGPPASNDGARGG